MAEVRSTQMTSVTAGAKLLPSADGGRKRLFFARYVQGGSTQAINDTIYLGDLPKGARICKDWLVNCSAGTASSTMDIGLRTKGVGGQAGGQQEAHDLLHADAVKHLHGPFAHAATAGEHDPQVLR